MIVSGAWTVKSLPCHYILDIPELGLKLARITPFRTMSEYDLTPYVGDHPRRIHGVPMPEYMYRLYGLEKAGSKTEMLHIRVTPDEKAQIELSARESGVNVAEYVRGRLLDGV